MMFEFRRLVHEDYDDIVDISKDIWEGGDYLPMIFHNWVDDLGYFLGIIDADKNKVVSVGKLSILSDGSGWLEGLRVHSGYRGLKLGRMLSEKLLEIAREKLSTGEITKIAFSSYIDNVESITLMGKLGFELTQAQLLVTKELDAYDHVLDPSCFKVEKWDVSYEEFVSLAFLKRRDNLLSLSFVFQEPTKELFEQMKQDGAFITVNGFNGVMKRKGNVNFFAADETIEAITAFMDYFIAEMQTAKGSETDPPVTYVLESDKELIEQLKQADYSSWSGWRTDYLYFTLK